MTGMSRLSSWVSRLSSWVYGAVLFLYPADLRREYGPEMREAFADDLRDAWRSHGFAGTMRVWWCTLCEVRRIAVPEWKTNPAVAVPAMALGLNVLVVGFELLLHLFYVTPPGPDGATSAFHAVQIVCGTSLVVTLISLAVVRAGKVRVVSLKQDGGGNSLCSKSAI